MIDTLKIYNDLKEKLEPEAALKIAEVMGYIDTFIRKKLKRLQGVHPHLFPILVTHMVSDSKVQKYAEGKGIAVYKSSQF